MDNGLPKTQIYSLASNDRYLFAGGTINGIWRRQLSEMIDVKELPDNFLLYQNYPNPFNPGTTITYSLPKQAFVELKIYDLLGREVTTLVNQEQKADEYKVQFDGSNLPSGMYIYSIQAGEFRASKKLLLIK
ncbi:MAG TPA: T9SS type A sorting domain-containing protein [Ignavibacteriales bacterium]|nr:T9SS type A sorting domain-containing protein [Ignavibacteriales bacterium]